MVQEDDYTFVTIDSDDALDASSFIVDVSSDDMLLDAVTIDEGMSADSSDFITLSDDSVVLSDSDMVDGYSIDMDGTDISFIL